MNLTLKLKLSDEYHELDSGIESLTDEYHELDSGIETNTTNWTLKLRLPDKYHKPDSRIEVAGLLIIKQICTYMIKDAELFFGDRTSLNLCLDNVRRD
ncbi:hypothetical protein RCL_jg19444.t1 [Rhizophagus clarus]|uniref:Uncharacterized protein n=1 Tax=Rhizophagus clarus TaxID=94130 RepID=A0A8H3LSP9_9GLOM|nr:hypothetical protein RCL_jg19444.t1 [Rhizophagus clarus]